MHIIYIYMHVLIGLLVRSNLCLYRSNGKSLSSHYHFSPGLIRQRSNEGIPRSHGRGTEERPGTAETSGNLTRCSPPDESLHAGNLTPLNISRRNNNLFQLSSGNRLPKKHANHGLGNVLAAITSKPTKTLTRITSDLNGAAEPDSPPRRSDCSALSKAFSARNSPKGTSCADINAESDSSGASSSQSDTRNFPRRPDSSRSDTRNFPRRSDSAGGLANTLNGLANALSTLNLHKAAPLLSITSESKSDGSVDTITDSTPRQSEEITSQSDDTPRQSDITISLKKSGNTPRKFGGDMVSFWKTFVCCCVVDEFASTPQMPTPMHIYRTRRMPSSNFLWISLTL